jgi:Bacterial capsule synthesis protein PGA_cap
MKINLFHLIAVLCVFNSSVFASVAHAEITITFGGDLNLAPSRAPINETGSKKHGTFYTWEEMFAGIAPLIDGELNFANVETVVTDRGLRDTGGKYTFITHPEGLAYAVDLGFNLLSLSNNHVGDYGVEGMEDTLQWLDKTNRDVGQIYYSGLGSNRAAALKPTLIPVQSNGKTYTIAFLAMTAVANAPSQATNDRAGTLYFRDENDFAEGLAALRNTAAHYKILSVHGGKEGVVTLDSGQQRRYNQALKNGDVDLLLGHHPHRVRPIEQVGHKLIFYSLGNYQMLGAADITGSDSLRDYGLFGKVHLEWDPQRSRLVAQASEIVALTNMQAAVRPLEPEDGAERVQLLNGLSEDVLGSTALTYKVNKDGYGEVCLGKNPGPRARAICN